MVSLGPPPGPEQDERPLAFLCHSSGDRERVRQLYRQLMHDGYKCWFDEEDLIPGQNWEREINRALRACEYVIVCLSQSSITKRGYVQKELKTALDIADELPEGEIFLIPVRLEPCAPPDHLKHLHWVDLFGEDDSGYRQLERALQPRRVSNAAIPASAWERIVPSEPERNQAVPWEKYTAATRSTYISYRRADARSIALTLYDRLADYHSQANVFMDLSSIGLGVNFEEALVRALSQSDAMLVVIGSRWLSAADAAVQQRTDSEDDVVFTEIRTALHMGVRIIPVLFDTPMPQATDLPQSLAAFASLSPCTLSRANFDLDLWALVAGLRSGRELESWLRNREKRTQN